MVKLLEQYKNMWQFIKENILKISLIMFVILIITQIVTYIVCINNSEIITSFIKELIDSLGDNLGKKGVDLLLFFWINNTRASLIALLLGIIPFLFLPVFSLIFNGISIGIVLGYSSVKGLSAIQMFLLGILPHGIFEITAFILSVSLGIFLCWSIIKDKGEKGKLKNIVINIFKIFVMIVIPLILIAGVVETYITPVLMNLVK